MNNPIVQACKTSFFEARLAFRRFWAEGPRRSENVLAEMCCLYRRTRLHGDSIKSNEVKTLNERVKKAEPIWARQLIQKRERFLFYYVPGTGGKGKQRTNGRACMRSGRWNHGSLPNMDRHPTDERYHKEAWLKIAPMENVYYRSKRKVARVPRRDGRERRAVFRAVGTHKEGKTFYVAYGYKRNERPNVGSVPTRSRNGAPFRRGCVCDQWSKG